MRDTDIADGLAVKQNGVAVDRVYVTLRRLGLLEAERFVLEIVGEHCQHVAQLKVQIPDFGGFAVEGDREHFLFDAEVVFVHSGYHSADLKDPELGSVAYVCLDLAKLGGDHGLAYRFNVGVGGVEELDIRLDFDTQRFQLVGVCPNV